MALERVASAPRLPKRPADAHKGMFGRILAIAGGRGMAGAAALVGASALRSGAGLVKVASPAEIQPTVASFEPSYMTFPLPQDDDGLIDFGHAAGDLERLAHAADVVAAGPGLGQSDGLRELVRWLIGAVESPVVLDADALNNLAGDVSVLDKLIRPVVLTPHPGEFARLIGRPTREVQADRERLAAEFASRDHLVLVLKGHQTIVTDGHRLYVNTTGNPGMATGGAGDCLTGVIAALLGQGMSAFDAATLGVFVHGLAGDIARDQNGEVGLIAGDIVDSLADAFYHLGVEG